MSEGTILCDLRHEARKGITRPWRGPKRAVQAVSKEDDGKRHVEQEKGKTKENGKGEKPADSRDGKWAAEPLRRLRALQRKTAHGCRAG